MVSEKMLAYGRQPSAIRELFEYGKKRAKEIGPEKIFDFSLGNPTVPTPSQFTDTLMNLIHNTEPCSLHGYTSGSGDMNTKESIAAFLRYKYKAKASADKVYMTCGAAASLTITLTALTASPDDEIIVFAPFFPEYTVFIDRAGAKEVISYCNKETMLLDFDDLERKITPNTKALILNSPNNPTGVIIPEKQIAELAQLLNQKCEEYGHPIYLITDDPYRELVYGDAKLVYAANYYSNSISCYSFSKSLSLPGERIGYICVHDDAADAADVYAAVCGAGRALGYVCAPSLFQKAVPSCLGQCSDLTQYDEKRKILLDALTSYGYKVFSPDGAFYLFVKCPEEDSKAFCEKAKKYELLLVPSDSFGMPGYFRISYSASRDTVINSLPAFEALAKEYK